MRHRQYSHWIIAALCGSIMVVGLLFNGTIVNNYTVTISSDIGISRTVFSLYNTMRSLTAFFVNLQLFRILKRSAIKPMILFGLLCSAAVQLILSFAADTIWICAAGLLAGIAYALCGTVTLSMILQNWFYAGYGTVFSAVMSASGLGGIVICPALSALTEQLGWRFGFRLLALVSLMIAALCRKFLHVAPEEIHTSPYGSSEASIQPQTPQAGRSRISILGNDGNSRNLRLLAFISGAFSLGTLAVYSNLSSIIQDIGFTVTFATGIAASCNSLANSFGKILMGWVNDHFGTKRMLLFWYGVCPFAMLYFVLMRNAVVAAAVPGIFLIGFTSGIYSVPGALVCSKLFPERGHYLYAVGICTAVGNLCPAVSGQICHGLYEQTGAYVSSMLFALLLACGCFAAVAALILKNRTLFESPICPLTTSSFSCTKEAHFS